MLSNSPPPMDVPADRLWAISSAVDLAVVRREIKDLAAQLVPPGRAGTWPEQPMIADPVERLLLVVSELATNGLRHAAPPVAVSVTRTAGSWLVVATDSAPLIGPRAHSRDPHRAGQHGLVLVEAVSESVGWYAGAVSKQIWALVPDTPTPAMLARLGTG